MLAEDRATAGGAILQPNACLDSQRLNDAVLDIASETKTLLFHRSQPSPIPAYTMTELWLGNAALDLAAEEIGGLFPELMRRSPG